MTRVVECPVCGHVWDPYVDPAWATSMRERRKALGLSLANVAREIGVSVAYVSDMERSRRNKPGPAVLDAWEGMLRRHEEEAR